MFSEVIVIYQGHDFYGVRTPLESSYSGPLLTVSQAKRKEEASQNHRQFNVLREVREVRNFRLLLCTDVWDHVGEYSVRVLKEAVAAEKAEGSFPWSRW